MTNATAMTEAEDEFDMEVTFQPASTVFSGNATNVLPRRAIMGVMRSASERRRSRVQSQLSSTSSSIQNQAGLPIDESFQSVIMSLGSNQPGAAAYEAITNNIAQHYHHSSHHQQTRRERIPSPLRNKLVYQLRCAYCMQTVCTRAMRAILLADTKIELYSTDIPPVELHLAELDRFTNGCNCRIRETICTCCGNSLGYHVSQPCERCLEARNNGHFWMFYSETVWAYERSDPATGKPMYWAALSPMRELVEVTLPERYEMYCR